MEGGKGQRRERAAQGGGREVPREAHPLRQKMARTPEIYQAKKHRNVEDSLKGKLWRHNTQSSAEAGKNLQIALWGEDRFQSLKKATFESNRVTSSATL